MVPFRSKKHDACRICASRDLSDYLDLGPQPPSNAFIRPADLAFEARFPLVIALCRRCGLSQLRDVVFAEDIFGDYLYLSSTSKALCEHYRALVDSAVSAFGCADNALMVDIGCNDGIVLACYPKNRFRLLGIEPSSAGAYARRAGFEVIPEFFDRTLGARIATERGGAAVVTATNVFAHVNDIVSFAEGVREMLAPDGVYIAEFPYLPDTVDGLYFDTIYHEHLSYLALAPLDRLFAATGLRAFRAERIHLGASGPALRLFACRKEAPRAEEPSIRDLRSFEASWGIECESVYRRFAGRVADSRHRMRGLLADLRARKARIGGYCAPAKGNTLLNYIGLGPTDIEAIAENNPLKIGLLTPGSHIPIVSDDEFLARGFTHALLLAWNYADFFLANAEFVKRGGRFIVPLPEPSVRP